MEKIYMDNNSSKNGINGKYHLSIILSFVVAVFAIVSLIAFGFNQISFAAPTEGAGESGFTPYTLKQNVVVDPDDPPGGKERPVGIGSFSDANMGSTGYYVPIMYIDLGNGRIEYVFCISEKSVEAGFGNPYTRQGPVDNTYNRKIAYILHKSGVGPENYGNDNASSIIPRGTGGDAYELLEAYATQVAIWTILGDPSINTYNNEITGASVYSLSVNRQGPTPVQDGVKYTGNLYSYIQAAINEAESYYYNKSLSVSLGSDVSDVEGTNYIQSSLVQVVATPVDDLTSFDVRFEGIEGIIAVDENGKEFSSLTGLSPSDKFYLRIPKDKITGGTNEATVHVTGHFKNAYVPYKYVNEGSQDLVRLEKGDVDLYGQGPLTIMTSPDTGASTSQTIYFIGLVVLLCGVGIIYANSKAIKNA